MALKRSKEILTDKTIDKTILFILLFSVDIFKSLPTLVQTQSVHLNTTT